MLGTVGRTANNAKDPGFPTALPQPWVRVRPFLKEKPLSKFETQWSISFVATPFPIPVQWNLLKLSTGVADPRGDETGFVFPKKACLKGSIPSPRSWAGIRVTTMTYQPRKKRSWAMFAFASPLKGSLLCPGQDPVLYSALPRLILNEK